MQDSFSHSHVHHNSLDGTSFVSILENSAPPVVGHIPYLGTPSVITLALSMLFIHLPVSVHVFLGADLSFWQTFVSLAHWA